MGRCHVDNKAMHKLLYGLFVLTTKVGDKENGCITNTAIQVASEPNQISFANNKANYAHDMVIQTNKCNIPVISEKADNGISYITRGANAYFSIDINQIVDLGYIHFLLASLQKW